MEIGGGKSGLSLPSPQISIMISNNSKEQSSCGGGKGKKAGRRRRNKKDVILDFRKHAGKKVVIEQSKKKPVAEAPIKDSPDSPVKMKKKKRGKARKEKSLDIIDRAKQVRVATEYIPPETTKKGKKTGDRFTLSTSCKDYEGNLGLPEKVTQRQFESTGQFFGRLNRLVARAKVEANLETRFDMKLKRVNHIKEAKYDD